MDTALRQADTVERNPDSFKAIYTRRQPHVQHHVIGYA